jgi:hypothetical protein
MHTTSARVTLIISVLALATAGSCHPQEERTREMPSDQLEPALVSLYQALDSDFPEQVREVVRDSARFRTVWDLSCCRRTGPTPRPEIDFTRYMVVLAVDSRRVLVDSVVIESVSEDNVSLRVRVLSDQTCGPVQVITSPVHLLRVPRSDREVVFENRAIRGPNCL